MKKIGIAHRRIFRDGSKTYFNATRFFPAHLRRDVYVLYAFARTADDYVDRVPQDHIGFEEFVSRYRRAVRGTLTGDDIVDSYVELSRRCSFDPDWTEAFLRSMRMDLEKPVHATLPETLEYVYGSAEVIGLFMARIMGLERRADRPACMLGRAMQFMNFIRDIQEDNGLGRVYLPISESTLPDLNRKNAEAQPQEFSRFISEQLRRYREWQTEAEAAYNLIPRKLRVPIKTAGDMYNWTGTVIARDPFVVYRRKVKPRRARIIASGIFNSIAC